MHCDEACGVAQYALASANAAAAADAVRYAAASAWVMRRHNRSVDKGRLDMRGAGETTIGNRWKVVHCRRAIQKKPVSLKMEKALMEIWRSQNRFVFVRLEQQSPRVQKQQKKVPKNPSKNFHFWKVPHTNKVQKLYLL